MGLVHGFYSSLSLNRIQSRPVSSFELYTSKPSPADLDKELESFFETASSSGAASIASLSPEERMERAMRGEFLENEIFDLREQLMDMVSSDLIDH